MARDRVLPTSLITLHILAVTVVLCSTFIAVFAGVGDSCNQDSECTGNGETCVDSTCTCKTDYYPDGNGCTQKVEHGGACNDSIADICKIPETKCMSFSNSQTYCLCKGDDVYYSESQGSQGACTSLDNLKVTDITAGTRSTNSVTLTWTANNHMSTVTYEIQAVPVDGLGQTVSGNGNQTGGTVTSLTSGTQYTFNVTSVIKALHYPQRTVSDSSTQVWTKAVHGGKCDDTVDEICVSGTKCMSFNNAQTYCLCEDDNVYYSESARACTPLDNLKVTGITIGTRNTNSVTLTWTANNHMSTVTYEIQAVPVDGLGQTGSGSGTQTGGTVTSLTSGTQYTFNVTSVINALYYPQRTVSDSITQVWTRAVHGGECDSNVAEICVSGTECKSFNTVKTYCLCKDDNVYYSETARGCTSLNNLKVTGITVGTRNTNSVSLTWTSSHHMSTVTYEIQAVPAGGQGQTVSGTADQRGGRVDGLISGIRYTFTVTSVIKATYYPERTVSDSSTQVWTKPAKPKKVTSVQLVDETRKEYNITFGASDGQVAYYTMIVNSANVTTNGPITSVKVTDLIAGQPYVYTITAYNGNKDPSEPFQNSFNTDELPPESVTDLMDQDKAEETANITWKKPMTPNGDITGYTLAVADKDFKCIYGFIINCSDCPLPGKSGDISQCELKGFRNVTSRDVNSTTATFFVHIEGLKPYHNYTVNVTADNIAGTGSIKTIDLRTMAAAAKDVTDVTPMSTRNSATGQVSLTVTWKPGDYTGPTNYLVTLKEQNSLGSDNFTKISVETVRGYNTSEWTKNDVYAYWNYRVFVQAMTSAGNSSVVGPQPVQTSTNTPGLPQNVTVVQDETVAQELALTVTCPEEKERNGKITGYVILKTLLDATGGVKNQTNYTVPADSSQTCTNTYTAKNVGGITVEENYTFSVMVRNSDFNGSYTQGKSLSVTPKVPRFDEILDSYEVPSLVSKQSGSTSSETEIDVSVCASCLLDGRQGTVTKVGLVVCKVGPDNQCINEGRQKRSDDIFVGYVTWSEARSQSFKVPYRATPDMWMNTLTSPNTSYPYRIGTDANCRTDAYNEYCNGPLPSDTSFRVAVIQCNSVGCVIGIFEGPYKTGAVEGEGANVAAIVGAVVAVLVVAAIVAGVAFFLWRRRKGKPTRTSNPIWDIDNQSKQNVPPPVSRPIRIRDFKDEVTKMHKDCNLMFQDQFEDIKKLSAELNATTNEAQREGNRVKNRYVDILPYDHSRVKLSTTPDDDETMDFINANYIAGYSSVREYIATQGPMHCTIPDFWRMAWEQNCRVIVMLSDLQENGKRKVGLYWPENLNDPINYGTVVVEMTNFSQLNKYIIRNFVVKKGNETRKMTHFFLPGWWDFSANLTFDDVLEFAKLVRQEATPHTDGPIIVHCSAGVGRTGTLIALDYFMQFIDKHSLDDTIDVYKFVLEMRKNRPRMVQAETQYIFIFDALVEVIQNKIKAEEERLYDNCGQGNNIYANVGNKQEENIYANTEKNAYVYNNEAFEPEYQNMEMKSQDKTEKPTTEL